MQGTQSDVVDGGKYRVLCLHGIGTNSEVFQAQTAALRYRLGPAFEYDFIDGAVPWPAYPGIGDVFGNDQIYFSYHDGTAQAACQAVDDLAEYATESGPFDAVLAFSSGASLAATLLIGEATETDSASQPPLSSFRNAIFLSATLPYDLSQLRKGEVQFLESKTTGQVIRIPTVHAYGDNDVEYRRESEQLVQMSAASTRSEIRHDAAHGVPTQGDALERLAVAILAAVSRTSKSDTCHAVGN